MLALLLACAPEEEKDTPSLDAGAFAVLSYNVHGFPSEITGDDSPARMAQIAPHLGDFDLIGLQEVWEEAFAATLDAGAGDVDARAELSEPVADDRVYGAGLISYARHAATAVRTVYYDDCYGTFDGASDCWASKGFIVMTLALAEGVEVDFYDSHMEAGSGPEDNAARASQVDALLADMNGPAAGRAVLFVGDTNLGGDAIDQPEVDRWMAGAGLESACDAVACPEPTRIDRILFRSGEGVTLSVDAWAVETSFVDAQGVALSDHEAISARMSWAR